MGKVRPGHSRESRNLAFENRSTRTSVSDLIFGTVGYFQGLRALTSMYISPFHYIEQQTIRTLKEIVTCGFLCIELSFCLLWKFEQTYEVMRRFFGRGRSPPTRIEVFEDIFA